jgi:hypothetical protein
MGRYSSILDELDARLRYHAGQNRILAGAKIMDEPVEEVETLSEFPIVAHYLPVFRQTYETHGAGRGLMTVRLVISTKKSSLGRGLLAWTERVMDSVVTVRDGTGYVDPTLGQRSRPPIFSMDRVFASTLGIHGELTIVFECDEVVLGSSRE